MLLKSGQLPLVAGSPDLHTCEMGSGEKFDHIGFVNTHTSAVNINLWYVPSGSTARRIIGKDLTLNANAHMTLDRPVYLAYGDILRGDATVASVVDYVIQGTQFAVEGVVSS